MKLRFCYLLLFLFSCKNTGKRDIEVLSFEGREISLESIEIDTLFLDKDFFSGKGFFSVAADEIFFIDQIFSTILRFDTTGKPTGKFLGKGDGPENQNSIHGFSPYCFQGNHLVLDNFEWVVMDSTFTKVGRFPIQWSFTESHQEMLNRPNGNMLGLYEIARKMQGENTGFLVNQEKGNQQFILPMTMSHPTLNGYISEEYYEDVFIFGKYDLNSKKIISGFGKRPPIYLSNKFVPNFDFFNYTLKSDSILVSFALDHLIQVYDPSGKLVRKYGVEGKSMKKSYPKTQTIEEAIDNYLIDLDKAGYYDHLFYDSKSDLTFRTYFQNGKNDQSSRLQIFSGSTLIGDVQVPNRFRVLGRSGDYFYADGIVDEVKDQLGIYRFKVDSNEI